MQEREFLLVPVFGQGSNNTKIFPNLNIQQLARSKGFPLDPYWSNYLSFMWPNTSWTWGQK